ncbi:H2A domain containing protein [Blumeria hordei DH14]|uniref:DNA polymerase epsilon subunit D n=1 Tax=Blumeria graminis f. sp. hordei (strain DH14) TaxID=546991 RepID=N1J6T5_BLUG1|nr:H2A domain containing protein [Blumeria hordei DH14]
MPPRKNEVPMTSAADENVSTKEASTAVNIEDLNLPKSIVTRLAKGVLPANTQIQSNAMLALTKSATIFISYIASQANENAATANRKTVTPNDVLAAIDDSEFSDWRPRLETELQKYTEMIGQRKEKLQSKEGDGSPRAKRLKRDGKDDEVFAGDKQEVSVSDEETSAQVDDNVDEDEDDADEDHETDDQGETEELLETEAAVLPELGDEALDNGGDSD